MPQTFKALELFAGAGGLALGFYQAGFQHQGLIENNKDAIATLKTNCPDYWNVIGSDIAEVDFSQFKEIDLVTAGFPCQPFSRAGKKLGLKDKQGQGFARCWQSIKQLRPKMFVLENVPGLADMKEGAVLTKMTCQLSALNYVVEWQILNAYDYEVPQNRTRLFIVGRQQGIEFEFPQPIPKQVTLREALVDVPLSEGARYSPLIKGLLDDIPPGGCWRSLHPFLINEYFSSACYGSGGRTSMLRRLRWDRPCPTLLTSPNDVRICRCHPDYSRPFTVREYARIQTFPDTWQFAGSLMSQYRQIGNAVPVKLARRIGQSCFASLTKATIKTAEQLKY